jgi:hypothetical protein
MRVKITINIGKEIMNTVRTLNRIANKYALFR